MENVSNIGNLFALSHDCVIYVENGIIAYMNPPALAMFGRDKQGMPERAILPEHLLEIAEDDFVASAKIDNRIMTVCRSNYSGNRLYSFYLPVPEEEQMAIHAVSATMRELANSIKTTSDLIAEFSTQYSDSFLERYTAVLKHNSAKMKRLVNNYALFCSFHLGDQAFHPDMESVSDICREIIKEAEEYTSHHKITISYRQNEEIISSVDKDLLQQMLLNLICNSLNNLKDEGSICLELKLLRSQIIMSISDNGSGMPTDVLVNAFKGYKNQLNLQNGNFTAGLGLSVADAIAKLHGGSLLIESKADQGTRVTVQFPRIVENRLKAKKVKYEVPLKEFIMTDLSTWLTWEDFLYYDKRDYEKRMARKQSKSDPSQE